MAKPPEAYGEFPYHRVPLADLALLESNSAAMVFRGRIKRPRGRLVFAPMNRNIWRSRSDYTMVAVWLQPTE